MDNTTARKLAQVPAEHIIVGIDPHKKSHAVAIMTQQAVICTKFKLRNDGQGFAQLVERVEFAVKKMGAKGALFAIEAGSHYWRNLAYYLHERKWSYYLVSPFTLKRQREGDDLTQRKSDYRDATMAAELLRTGKFTETRLLEGDYAALRAAHLAYQRLKQEGVRMINLMRSLLDGLFPEFCATFRDPTGQSAQAVLCAGLTPGEIASLTLDEFVARVGPWQVGRRLARQKLGALHVAAASTVGVKPGAREVARELQLLAQRYGLLAAQVDQMEGELRQMVHRFAESRYVLSVPGLSELTVAGLVAHIGPLANYGNAKDLVKLAGVNPIRSESAEKGQRYTPMSKKGRSPLRACLWQASMSLLRRNEEFTAWGKGMGERAAHAHPLQRREVLGAAMNKLLRLYFALVRKEQMYKPTVAATEGVAA